MDLDLVDPDVYADEGIPDDPDFWAVTRFDDVVHVSRHPEIFSSHRRLALFDEPSDGQLAFDRQMLLNEDPPRHTRKRALVSRGFTPRTIARLEQHIRDI